MKAAGLLLVMLLLLPSTGLAAGNADAVAVIIGNRTYPNGDLPEVGSAHGDAEAMKRFATEMLGYREDRILMLKDATLDELEEVFGEDPNHDARIFDLVRPGRSDVLIFYVGHGRSGRYGRDYLLPVDVESIYAERSAYPLARLYANLARLSARSVSLYLGVYFFTRLPDLPPDMTVVTALRGGTGGFTRHLLNGLYGAADLTLHGDGDGAVMLGELERYLGEIASQGKRIPRIYGDRRTVLSVYRRRRPAAPTTAQAPARPAGTIFRDCEICPEMVALPGGLFMMGSPPGERDRHDKEGPAHEVSIGAFAIGRYEVTRGEYAFFVHETGYASEEGCYVSGKTVWQMDRSKSWRDPEFRQSDRHPVVCVSWPDAKAYAAWLSQRTGWRYRLPSEAEWEYAARAGITGPFWFGKRIRRNQANYWRRVKATEAVGSYTANSFGLFDVHGNVWEWVEDCSTKSYVGAPADGSAWISKSRCRYRIMRGGSWNNPPSALRSAYRVGFRTTAHNYTVGFRVARKLD